MDLDCDILKRVELIEKGVSEALTVINSMANERQRLPSKSFESDSEERSEVFTFMMNILNINSGNLMNIDVFLKKRYGFSEEKAEAYLFELIDTYKSQSNTPVNVITEVSQKKKGPKPYSMMTPEELIIAKEKRSAKKPSNSTKRILKTRVEGSIKSKGLLVWNSFVSSTRKDMENTGSTVTYDEVVARAVEIKKNNPEIYSQFSENWSADQ